MRLRDCLGFEGAGFGGSEVSVGAGTGEAVRNTRVDGMVMVSAIWSREDLQDHWHFRRKQAESAFWSCSSPKVRAGCSLPDSRLGSKVGR